VFIDNFDGITAAANEIIGLRVIIVITFTAVASGKAAAVITLWILPTNETRLMQEFVISLVTVEPNNAVSLMSGFSSKRFLVPDVGNPGGVFSFGPDMNASYTVRVMLLLSRQLFVTQPTLMTCSFA